jgi:hypothetical protein
VKVVGAVIVLIGCLHVALGLGADKLLDPSVPTDAVSHPSLDSQNRFYGAAFAIFGVLLWMCSTDMTRYADVFRALMIVFFIGGLTRIVSFVVRGRPSLQIIGLAALELAAPPLLLWWQASR